MYNRLLRPFSTLKDFVRKVPKLIRKIKTFSDKTGDKKMPRGPDRSVGRRKMFRSSVQQ